MLSLLASATLSGNGNDGSGDNDEASKSLKVMKMTEIWTTMIVITLNEREVASFLVLVNDERRRQTRKGSLANLSSWNR